MSEQDFGRRRFLGGAAMAAGALAAARGTAALAASPAAAPYEAPLKDVAGKVAFITGASSGIGLGQAHVFHDAGMSVAIGYIRDDQREEAAQGFRHDLDRIPHHAGGD